MKKAHCPMFVCARQHVVTRTAATCVAWNGTRVCAPYGAARVEEVLHRMEMDGEVSMVGPDGASSTDSEEEEEEAGQEWGYF